MVSLRHLKNVFHHGIYFYKLIYTLNAKKKSNVFQTYALTELQTFNSMPMQRVEDSPFSHVLNFGGGHFSISKKTISY